MDSGKQEEKVIASKGSVNVKKCKHRYINFFTVLGLFNIIIFVFLFFLLVNSLSRPQERPTSVLRSEEEFAACMKSCENNLPLSGVEVDCSSQCREINFAAGDPRTATVSLVKLLLTLLGLDAILVFIYGFFVWILRKRSRRGKIMMLIAGIFLFFICALFLIINFKIEKPVIYLYPEKEQEVIVRLNYRGLIVASNPGYDKKINGWQVTAFPNGNIIKDEQIYKYLFWEGRPFLKPKFDLSRGFVVRGKEAEKFLHSVLPKMGLIEREYDEFIAYWLPRLKKNEYNLIHFADREYTDTAPLEIAPAPDSVLRVFMVFKPLKSAIEVEPQQIESFEREGFTVIEWGGAEL